MPDDSPPPSTNRQRRASDQIGYLSRDQRRELELLKQLFRSVDPIVRFRPAVRTMRGYQEFTTGTVWYLVALARRGWVELVERTPAGAEEEQWWEEIAAAMTAVGRSHYLALRDRAALEDAG
jgi:hypothetical protein